VTGCSDSVVRLWDTRSSCKIGKLKGHHDIVRSARIIDSGGSSSIALVTAASDGVVCVWDVRMQSHALIKTLPCQDDSIWAMALLSDPSYSNPSSSANVVITGSRNGSVCLSNLRSGESHLIGHCPFPVRKLFPVPVAEDSGSGGGWRVYVAGDCTSLHCLTLPSLSVSFDDADQSAEGGKRKVEESIPCGEGLEGLGACSLMSDRMRAVCETTEGDVVMCSVLTGVILHRWAKGTKRSDAILQADSQTLVTPPWCTVDTKLGCIRCVTCFHDLICLTRNVNQINIEAKFSFRCRGSSG
jgi:hypothetical protein